MLCLLRNARQIQSAESQNQTHLLVFFFSCDQHLLLTSFLLLPLKGILFKGLKTDFVHTDILVLVFFGCYKN